jgi:HPt (histidine-containing phosphotransfer) domain-containing protein
VELDPRTVRAFGDPDTDEGRSLLAELFDAFVDDTRLKVERLRDALAEGEARRVRSLAHEQKGACATVGAAAMAARFYAIERQPDDPSTALRVLVEIEAALGGLADEVAALLRRTPR